ncbi:MAG: hypothetical protein ABIR30_04595 [Chitinophagaceae bacterium]
MKAFLPSLLLLFSACTTAQTGTELLKEVKTQLENGSVTVSTILADNKYASLHPETSFRQLIEKYSATGVLKIAAANEPGRKIKVFCTINDQDGKPVPGVSVYLYQTDYRGWYAADAPHVGGNEGDMRHARLFGYVKTDNKGQFELHTVKPSGYPSSDLPAHIHIHFFAAGYNSSVTEFLFDDDERLVGNIREQAVRNRFLIAQPGKASAPFEQSFNYSITLQKL